MNGNIKSLCFKYFSGEITSDAARAIRTFRKASPGNEAQFRAWEAEWKGGHIPTLRQIDSYKRLDSRIGRRRMARRAVWALPVAAAIAVVMLLGPSREPAPEIPVEPNVFTVETGFREQTKLILPDSTMVWMNSASRLSYDDNYNKGNRRVRLEGEAFFDVRHSDEHPFTVDMGENSITVHGTRFNVCSYPGEHIVEAALVEGGIAFSNNAVKVDMQPGEILSIDTFEDKLVKYSGDVAGRCSWMGGVLQYSSIKMDRLLTRISTIYGAEIRYVPTREDPTSFGIVLSIKESIPNILDAIDFFYPIRWREEDGIYYVEDK